MEIRFLDVCSGGSFDEVIEYYNAESTGLGDEFLLAVLDSLERIRQFPEAWHPYTKNSRRCQTPRFPYGIVYQVLESTILVVAVAHLHRRPGYLQSSGEAIACQDSSLMVHRMRLRIGRLINPATRARAAAANPEASVSPLPENRGVGPSFFRSLTRLARSPIS